MAARARRCGSGQAAINEIDLVANAGVLWHTISANFPAISRFTRCSVPLPTPTSVATLRIPLPALGVLDRRWPLLAHTVEAGDDPAANDLS